MNFNEYQEACKRTENPSLSLKEKITNWIFGLSGEVGEVTELVKKDFFHNKPYNLEDIKLEISDVLYYLSALCTAFGFKLEDVAIANVEKLQKRYPNGFPVRS